MSIVTLRLETYAEDARALIGEAQTLADERGHANVEPLHLLHRMLDTHEWARGIVAAAGADADDVLLELEAELRRLPRGLQRDAYLSARLLDALTRAEGEAARSRGAAVSVAHLLLACAQETPGPVQRALAACGLSAPVLRAVTERKQEPSPGTPSAPTPRASTASGVEEFGDDLTALAAHGRLDPTVGRDDERRRALQILARRHENAPLFVGDAGIGKSAIVRGLAQRIAAGDAPAMWLGKRVLELHPAVFSEGTKLRSESDERLRRFLNHARDVGDQLLVYLRDLSIFLGERSPAAASDLFTSALSRGELRVIATATPSEAQRLAEKSPTLARRFVRIDVSEPSIDETTAILRGIVGRFEAAHGLRIADAALIAAPKLARRYIHGVALPKAAIDLIDEAAARVRVDAESLPHDAEALLRELEEGELALRGLADETAPDAVARREALQARLDAIRPTVAAKRGEWKRTLDHLAEARRLRAELDAIDREIDGARARGDLERVAELQAGQRAAVTERLANAHAEVQGARPHGDVVDEAHVADVVATATGVPTSRMLEGDAEKLLSMEARLEARVVGQSDAVLAVTRAVRRGRIGLRDPKRPIGSFLFLGPSGVGKTELAKALAEFLFDDEASMTRIDMSEFMEKHSVARLLGAPPGYVDSEEGGYLTEAVRRRPYSVVLFDEMEKAHPDVFNILLQVLDDGRLTDSRGRVAHFSDTVVIMTSNLGAAAILDHEGDEAALKEKIFAELRRAFRPEFLNRIDDVVVFERLTKDTLAAIANIQLAGLRRMLAERGIELVVTDAAKSHLVELGYDPAFGARPLRRVLVRELQDPLAEHLLRRGAGGATGRVDVDVEGGRIVFRGLAPP